MTFSVFSFTHGAIVSNSHMTKLMDNYAAVAEQPGSGEPTIRMAAITASLDYISVETSITQSDYVYEYWYPPQGAYIFTNSVARARDTAQPRYEQYNSISNSWHIVSRDGMGLMLADGSNFRCLVPQYATVHYTILDDI